MSRPPTWADLVGKPKIEIVFVIDGVLHTAIIRNEKQWDSVKDFYWDKVVSYKIMMTGAIE